MTSIQPLVETVVEQYRSQTPRRLPRRSNGWRLTSPKSSASRCRRATAKLLVACHGLSFNGAMFSPSADATTAKGVNRFGIIESNQRLALDDDDEVTDLRFVGETGNQLFAFHRGTAEWQVVDRIGRDLDSDADRFASFEALFARQVERFA